MMKLVNKMLRFIQLGVTVVLMAGYFLHDYVWEFILCVGLDVTFDFVVDTYLAMIAIVLGLVPVRYVVEKIVESKFLI